MSFGEGDNLFRGASSTIDQSSEVIKPASAYWQVRSCDHPLLVELLSIKLTVLIMNSSGNMPSPANQSWLFSFVLPGNHLC